jgi:hypothetical protein
MTDTPALLGFKLAKTIRQDTGSFASVTDMQTVNSELNAGHPIIASCQGGPFCGGGHFIVIRGVTGDGKYLINNPNDFVDANGTPVADVSGNPPATTPQQWPASLFESIVTGMWSYSK